jgi:hypothetical protein
MDAVGVLWRGLRRRRWRSWVALTLILAIGAGAGLACLAGARRTASTFDRYAEGGRVPDVNTGHGEQLAEAEDTIGGFEGLASHASVVGFVGFVDGLDPALLKYFIGTWDAPVPWVGTGLNAGRLPRPDRTDEVIVVGEGVEAAGLEPGDEITVELFTTDFSRTVAKTVVVVGTGEDPLAAVSDATYDRTAVFFTPAFTQANAPEHQAWSATEFIAEDGAEEQLLAQLNEEGWSIDETRPVIQTRVQDAIRPLVTVLALLGVLVFAATVLVVGQALARQSDASLDERRIAQAMGFTPWQLRALDALVVLAVALPGALLAIGVAAASSPLFPAGAVRQLDPSEGAFLDLTVLSAGAVGVLLILVVLSAAARARDAGRTSRSAARPLVATLAAASPSVTPGLRLAVGGTIRQRRQFLGTVARSALGLALLVGGVSFVAALDRLTDEPARYGAGWELTTRNAFGDVPAEDVRALTAGDPDIVGLTGGSLNSVRIDDLNVPMMAFQPITAALWPTLLDGTVPRDDDEVLVGVDVLEALDARIGDEVHLASPYRPDSAPLSATIVGTAVFPSIEVAGVNPARLGRGVAIPWDGYQAVLAGSFDDAEPDMVFFDLADGADPHAVIDRYPDGMPEVTGFAPTEWLTSLAPAEVLETDRATGLIWSVIALLAVTVLAGLGHSLAGSVRQHRRDYAILKAIGFTRRQVLGSVAWQSTVPIVLALVLALPLGAALGRWWWQLLARLMGVIDTPVVPVAGLALVTAGTLAAAGLVAIPFGLRSARTPAAAGLKDE